MAIALNNKNQFDWFQVIIFGIAVAFVLFLASCSCDYHLTKARSKCGITKLTDTIYKKDSVFVDRIKKDTAFYFNQTDTVIIREGRLTMKYFYRDSTVYLSGTCDTIKIIREVPVIVNTTELKTNWWDGLFSWTNLLVMFIFLAFLYMIKNK
jgi:hypothetical protein